MQPKIHLFGHRVLLEKFNPEGEGRVIIPDTASHADTHRLGKVRVVGDGIGPDGKVIPSLVQVEESVLFQVNDAMAFAFTWRDANDRLLVHLLQTDLIARINGPTVLMDTFEILGDWVLIRWELQHKGKIILPSTAEARRTPDMFKYYVVQKGATVTAPIEIGDEVICNMGRLNVLFIAQADKIQLEFGYINQEFLCGVVTQAA